MRLSDLRIDPVKRQDGDWVELENLNGKIKVRGARNYDWLKVIDAETVRIRKRDEVRGALDHKQQREVKVECILQAGLIDWGGRLFTDDEGKPIPYSPDKAAEIYKDPAFEVLVDITAQACETMAYVSQEDEAKAEKN